MASVLDAIAETTKNKTKNERQIANFTAWYSHRASLEKIQWNERLLWPILELQSAKSLRYLSAPVASFSRLLRIKRELDEATKLHGDPFLRDVNAQSDVPEAISGPPKGRLWSIFYILVRGKHRAKTHIHSHLVKGLDGIWNASRIGWCWVRWNGSLRDLSPRRHQIQKRS
jgi:hypothetical protein